MPWAAVLVLPRAQSAMRDRSSGLQSPPAAACKHSKAAATLAACQTAAPVQSRTTSEGDASSEGSRGVGGTFCDAQHKQRELWMVGDANHEWADRLLTRYMVVTSKHVPLRFCGGAICSCSCFSRIFFSLSVAPRLVHACGELGVCCQCIIVSTTISTVCASEPDMRGAQADHLRGPRLILRLG